MPYSPEYIKATADATSWIEEKLKALNKPVTLTEEDYSIGVDALSAEFKTITAEVFQIWLKEKHYELSYSQVCNAFFNAARKLNLLIINQND